MRRVTNGWKDGRITNAAALLLRLISTIFESREQRKGYPARTQCMGHINIRLCFAPTLPPPPLELWRPFSIFVSDDFFLMKNSYDMNLPAVVCLFLCIFVSICLSVSMSVYLIVCLFAHLLGYISLHASVLTGRQIGTQKDKHTTRLY